MGRASLNLEAERLQDVKFLLGDLELSILMVCGLDDQEVHRNGRHVLEFRAYQHH